MKQGINICMQVKSPYAVVIYLTIKQFVRPIIL